MQVYSSISEAINAIPFGYCTWCEAEHEFNNIKCELNPALVKEGDNE